MEVLTDKKSANYIFEANHQDTAEDKTYNSGIQALLSIRNFSQVLEKDYVQMIKLEKK